MIQSDFCILHGMTKENRFSMGECKNDRGGYFIIEGKEKVIIPRERNAVNVLFTKSYSNSNKEEEGGDEDENNNIKINSVLHSVHITSVIVQLKN